MGGGLTDDNRGVLGSSRGTQGLDTKTVEALTQAMRATDTSAQKYATDDVAARRPLVAQMMAQHWSSERDRRVYMKYYIAASYIAGGYPLDNDELYGAMYMYENDYQKKVAARLAAQKVAAATGRVMTIGQSAPMNPMNEFEAWIQVPLETARRDVGWVDTGIIEVKPDISDDWQRQALILLYEDGHVLSVPLAPVPVVFLNGQKEKDVGMTYFRRHKKSGRLLPFQPSWSELHSLPSDAPYELAFQAIAPRFDPELTPHMITWLRLAKSRNLGAQFGILIQGFGALSAASGGAGAVGKWATKSTLGAGLPGAIDSATTTARAAAATGRAAIAHVEFALEHYSYLGAVGYLGRTAWGFYLRNAVAVNLLSVTVTELTLNIAGEDTGPVSVGDSLYIAVSGANKEAKLVKAEVEAVDKAASTITAKIVGRETIAADEAAKEADFVAHVPKGQGTTVPNPPVLPAADAKAIKDSRATSDAARATEAAAKEADAAAKVKKAKVPKVPYDISKPLLTQEQADKLVKWGVHPDAVEKLLNISANDLAAARLDAEQVANLYKQLMSSGKNGRVVDFINTFHDAPNFQLVVLSWASGGKSQKAANFAMAFALEHFPGVAIRFEWPVAAAVTKAGEETSWAARYVDIIVDGGNRFRAGESIRIELKAWSQIYLSSAKSDLSIAQQLARDTAWFGKENIRWVFNSADKVTKEMAVAKIMDVIKKDPVLWQQWKGTDDEITAALSAIVSVYP